MNYEKRFKRFTAELLTLIERHLKEWDEAEQGIYDIDEIMASAESDFNKESMPVVYPRKTKKSAER